MSDDLDLVEDCQICIAKAGEPCYLQAGPPRMVRRGSGKFDVHHNRSGVPWTPEEAAAARWHNRAAQGLREQA